MLVTVNSPGRRSIHVVVLSSYTTGPQKVALYYLTVALVSLNWFSPRCMQCRHGIAMRILSVCLSVKRVICDKMEEKSVQIFIPYGRSFSLVFWEEWLVGATPSTWNFGSTGYRWSKFADFQPIFARVRSSSAVTSNRKSTTRFLMSQIWSSYVAPKSPKGGLKNAKWPISV